MCRCQIVLGLFVYIFFCCILKAGFALTVLTRLPVICHHWIGLRFIKSHSSDDHSIGSSLRHLRSLLVSHDFGSHLRFGFNDLSRTISLQEGCFFPNKLLLILFLLVVRWIHKASMRRKHKPYNRMRPIHRFDYIMGQYFGSGVSGAHSSQHEKKILSSFCIRNMGENI